MIKLGAHLDMQDEFGYTALMRAESMGHKAIAELLREAAKKQVLK